jgi:integral membrane protein
VRGLKDRLGLILRAMKTNDTISRLRMLGYFEAFSWVLLLFIAMPLKYFGGQPIMVKYVGWVHGILFILYSLHLILAMRLQSWSFGKLVTGGVAAFLPFGTLWFDKRIK